MSRPAELPGLVARLRAAGCVFAQDEAALLVAEAPTAAALDAMATRRVAGEPLELVLGWAEFCGLRVAVAPGVFVPRRRTELLARRAVAAVLEVQRPDGDARAPVVVDLCCGTGAVAAAVLAAVRSGLPAAEVHAADVDPAAVACAHRNLDGAGGHVHAGDLYDALPRDLRGRVDVLAANAPYVPTDAVALMPPEARLHEARAALDGGSDGLDVQRRIIEGAPQWLAPGGVLLVETSRAQAPVTEAAMNGRCLRTTVLTDDDLDATVVAARSALTLTLRQGRTLTA